METIKTPARLYYRKKHREVKSSVTKRAVQWIVPILIGMFCIGGMTGCGGMTDVAFGNSAKFSYFPALYNIDPGRESSRLSVNVNGENYYFYTPEEGPSGIYRQTAEGPALIYATETLSAIVSDGQSLYFSCASDPDGAVYDTIVRTDLSGRELQSTRSAHHTARLLLTEDGLFALAHFLSSTGSYNGVNESNFYFFPGADLAAEPVNLLEAGIEYTSVKNTSDADSAVDFYFARVGDTVFSYLDHNSFEIFDLSTGHYVSATDVYYPTIWREENGTLTGYRISFETGDNLIRIREDGVTEIPVPEEVAAAQRYTHAVPAGDRILMFNSVNYFGSRKRQDTNFILAYDLETGTYEKLADLPAEWLILMADPEGYVIYTGESGEVRQYAYGSDEALKSQGGFSDYCYGMERCGDLLLFYDSDDFNYRTLERINFRVLFEMV